MEKTNGLVNRAVNRRSLLKSGALAHVALSALDPDGLQYITSNTLDEIGHATFLNAYLESKGAEPVNLMRFNVDTTWFTRLGANGDVNARTREF